LGISGDGVPAADTSNRSPARPEPIQTAFLITIAETTLNWREQVTPIERQPRLDGRIRATLEDIELLELRAKEIVGETVAVLDSISEFLDADQLRRIKRLAALESRPDD
jgi:hypothetical protein